MQTSGFWTREYETRHHSDLICRNEKKVMETTTSTAFPVCVLSPSPLPKSPEACETETDVTPERSDALMKTLRDKHSQRQSHPRRRTDARPPEGFPPPSALRSHPENTQTHTQNVFYFTESTKLSVMILASSENSEEMGHMRGMTHAERNIVPAVFQRSSSGSEFWLFKDSLKSGWNYDAWQERIFCQRCS